MDGVVPILSSYSISPPPTSYSPPYDTSRYTFFDSYGHVLEATSYPPASIDPAYPPLNYGYHPYAAHF